MYIRFEFGLNLQEMTSNENLTHRHFEMNLGVHIYDDDKYLFDKVSSDEHSRPTFQCVSYAHI